MISLVNIIICVLIGKFYVINEFVFIITQSIYMVLYAYLIFKVLGKNINLLKNHDENICNNDNFILKMVIFYMIIILSYVSVDSDYQLAYEVSVVVIIVFYIVKTILNKLGITKNNS